MFFILHYMMTGAETTAMLWDLRIYEIAKEFCKVNGRWAIKVTGGEDYRLAEMYFQLNYHQVSWLVCHDCLEKGEKICGHLTFGRMIDPPEARRILVCLEDRQWEEFKDGWYETPTRYEMVEIPAHWDDNQIGQYLDWQLYGENRKENER